MDLLAAWVLYPVALGVVCLGLGLLVARISGWEIPALLLLPVGCVTLLAYARPATEAPGTARLALPVLLALVLAGLVLSRARLRALRPDPLLVAAGIALFYVLGAPVLASGHPTFAGYLALPDTSHQLSLAHLLADKGADASTLPIGSFHSSMTSYLASRYPLGGQAALGITAPLGTLDIAWLYQPFLTFLVLIAGLALASIARPLMRARWQTALVAFLAPQSALVVGFLLQGSIKELAALTAIVGLVAALAAALLGDRPARSLLAVALAAAATILALGPAAIPYLCMPALVVAGWWGLRLVRRRDLTDAAWLAIGGVVAVGAAWPVLGSVSTAISVSKATLVSSPDLGNLAFPLKAAQAIGPWLTGDYRYRPAHHDLPQNALLWFFAIVAAVGLVRIVWCRGWGPLLLLATLGPASAYLLDRGGPYADAKVLMILSVLVPLLALVGAAVLGGRAGAVLAGAVAAVLAGGLVWSSALAYHDASLAPYDRYKELLSINERYAGKGPVMLDEYDEFAKYFLRDLPVRSAPEAPFPFLTHEQGAPYDPDALNDPKRRPSVKTPASIDDLFFSYIEQSRYVLLRRSPTLSRPPANYRLVWRGRFYELWRRSATPRILRHRVLGPDVFRPAQPVSRAVARSVATRAERLGGRIAYVPRARPPHAFSIDLQHPARWVTFGNYPGALVPAGPGSVRTTLTVPHAGRYRLWVEGSFARRMTMDVDGRVVGTVADELNNPGEYASFGPLALTRGRHEVAVSQGGGDLSPGSGGYLSSLRHVGALYLAPIADETPAVRTIDPRDWRRIVGVNSDWLEVVR